MRIDTHQHFWKINDTDYPWITEQLSVIRRDFLPDDLAPLLKTCNLDASIAVQARQSAEETSWLLSLADTNQAICGVVGWVPLAEKQGEPYLEQFADHPKLLGVRHVVQDEPDDQFILGTDFNEGVARLKQYDLVYDILIFAKHLQPTIEFVDRHPDQPMVLDHIAKPTITPGQFDEEWKKGMLELGKRPNVYCKLSGMATEVRAEEWDESLLEPYFDIALESFGAKRLVYGSDWPVCLLMTEYQRWYETVERYLSKLTEAEQKAIWSDNAKQAYKMP
ncbi:MAG: amidohydrolase family protein [Planctomycetota bacterium]